VLSSVPSVPSAASPPFSRIDALLLVMATIWGTNYSIVKAAFREIDAQAFNACRMVLASSIFLAIIVGLRVRRTPDAEEPSGGRSVASIFRTPAPITTRDWLELAGLGLVGHALYQYCFIGGLARTTVANSSLMLAATPVVIALMSAGLGYERVSTRHWIGAALSMIGIYVVVGHGAAVSGQSMTGDLMMLGAVMCWGVYTLGARRLISIHSPVGVTGLSMSFGTLLYVPAVWAHLSTVRWSDLSAGTWMAIGYSSVFALCIAYTIWYVAVRQIGNARTSVYSNVIPIVAMITAVVALGEPLGMSKIAGAAAVLVGVALTRTGTS
jgi:drug/metabolite transporter (DMT)-like permease